MIFESIDSYAERWAKREQDDLKYLSTVCLLDFGRVLFQ